MNDDNNPVFDHASVWLAIALGALCLASQLFATC